MLNFNYIKNKLLILAFVFTLVAQNMSAKTDAKRLVIWHDYPGVDVGDLDLFSKDASKKDEYIKHAFPIGFGRYGALFNGGVNTDHLVCNEHSMWDGVRGLTKEDQGGAVDISPDVLANARKLIRDGKYANGEAEKYALGNLGGRFFMGNYLPFTDIFIKTSHGDKNIVDYKRELDLTQAIGKVSYKIGNTKYKREYFCSHPDQVMLIRYTSDGGKMNINIRQDALHKAKKNEVFENRLVISGNGPDEAKEISLSGNGKAVPKGKVYQEVIPASDRAAMKFMQVLHVHQTDGDIVKEEGSLSIKNATNIVLAVVATTDYLPEYPTFNGKDVQVFCNKTYTKIESTSYENLKARHIEDYKNLFDRSGLQLAYESSGLSSDKLLAKGASRELDELYFHYGRYLMIASSRTGAIPSNLQGIWNLAYNPAWDCDYHTDINIEMNYWMTETANLTDCFTPFLNWMKIIRESGTYTADRMLGARGWAIQTTSTVFGNTALRKHFRPTFNLISGAWLSQHLFEHYAFSQDRKYLKEVYPILKESAQFYLDFMVKYTDGTYVLSPTWSAENVFKRNEFGGLNKITEGAAIDQQIMYNLFVDCYESAKVLGVDEGFQKELLHVIPNLSPQRIGQHGQLQEWVEDWDDPTDQHRHVSHLWALHPGRDISPLTTPKLNKAAFQSLEYRGGGQTGWSRAWKINFCARFHDGDYAYEILSGLYDVGTLPNFLDTHPPFQIDGNFGANAGVYEMLLQSHLRSYTNDDDILKAANSSYIENGDGVFKPKLPSGKIIETPYILHVLPALPSAWSKGEMSGIRARGGFEVDLKWKDGELENVKVHSKAGKAFRIYYNGKLTPIVDTKQGDSFIYSKSDLLN